MSLPLLRRPRSTSLAVAPLALVLAGCGAGLDPQTYGERTAVDATNVSDGTIDVRNLRVEPPAGGIRYDEGADATVNLTIINSSSGSDTLVSATSPEADEVVLLQDGRPVEVEVPASGSTEGRATLILRGLTSELLVGEYVTLTLRFAEGGNLEVLVPVATNGRANRDVFTGEEGSEEGEPALGGPAGGHSAGGEEG